MEDDEAARLLRESVGSTSFTVYHPVVRGARQDMRAAPDIASFLITEGFGTAVVADQSIPVPQEYSATELGLLRETASVVSEYLQLNPIGTEFAVFLDYVMGNSTSAQCVHVYVFTGDGRIAYARAFNQRSESFRAESPATTPECTAFATGRLRAHFLGQDQ
jgi:hypothetical protein